MTTRGWLSNPNKEQSLKQMLQFLGITWTGATETLCQIIKNKLLSLPALKSVKTYTELLSCLVSKDIPCHIWEFY